MRLEFDGIGQKYYETGVSKTVLYLPDETGAYNNAEAWNGVTSIEENPDGGDEQEFFADNIKYGGIRAAEKYAGSINAYTYPDLWKRCDGRATLRTGITIGQQKREKFGLCFRTEIGNDLDDELGYQLHLVWGATTSPSSKTRETRSDSPEPNEFSWEFSTTPVPVDGFKPTSELTVDSRTTPAETLKKIEDILYGTESDNARLPLPNEIMELISD